MLKSDGRSVMIDLLIAGGGYVGLSLAVSVKKAAPHLSVTLIDGAPEGEIGRASCRERVL